MTCRPIISLVLISGLVSQSLLAKPQEVDIFFLQYLEKAIIHYCQYEGETPRLLDELNNASRFKIVDAKYTDETKQKITGFILLPKQNRPGLNISMVLKDNECASFELVEIVH